MKKNVVPVKFTPSEENLKTFSNNKLNNAVTELKRFSLELDIVRENNKTLNEELGEKNQKLTSYENVFGGLIKTIGLSIENLEKLLETISIQDIIIPKYTLTETATILMRMLPDIRLTRNDIQSFCKEMNMMDDGFLFCRVNRVQGRSDKLSITVLLSPIALVNIKEFLEDKYHLRFHETRKKELDDWYKKTSTRFRKSLDLLAK